MSSGTVRFAEGPSIRTHSGDVQGGLNALYSSMVADDPTLRAVIHEALAEMKAVQDRAIEAIVADPDLDAAFDAAGQLVAGVGELQEAGSEVRRDRARKVWEKEKLSLAKLADRWGMSKTRADQLLNKDRTRKGQPDDE